MHLDKLLKYADNYIKKYYNSKKYIFKGNSMDLEDVQQLGRVKVWNICNKYTHLDFIESRKLVSRSLFNFLQRLKNKCIYRNNLISSGYQVNDSDLSETDSLDFISSKKGKRKIDFYSCTNKEQFLSYLENLLEIRVFWSEEDKTVIFEKVIERRTFADIGRRNGMHEKRAQRIYASLIEKLGKKLK